MAEEFTQNHGENIILNELALTKMIEPDDVAPTIIFYYSTKPPVIEKNWRKYTRFPQAIITDKVLVLL